MYLAAGSIGAIMVAVLPGGAVRAELLDGVDNYVLAQLAGDHLAALEARATDPRAWRSGLEAVGAALGTMLRPALDAVLPAVSPGTAARAVFVPGGVFGHLPLQTAWWQDGPDRRYLIDLLEPSVVPNARTLQACRRLAETADTSSVLTIGAPERVDVAPLPLARAESDAVRSRFERGEQLVGHGATREAVLGALGRHGVHHFACHGQAEPDRPLDSALLLAGDDELRVRDLLATGLPGARLAVLSACETARTGRPLTDEVVGLPSAFLQAGVAGVIGTSWEVGDESAALVVRRFFDTWTAANPAAALRTAQLWLRDSTNAEKYATYPDLAACPPPNLDEQDLQDWAAGRDHAGVEHWGAFVYTGA